MRHRKVVKKMYPMELQTFQARVSIFLLSFILQLFEFRDQTLNLGTFVGPLMLNLISVLKHEQASPLNRTDPVIRYESQQSPSKVHKSRKDRLEMNPSSKTKNRRHTTTTS